MFLNRRIENFWLFELQGLLCTLILHKVCLDLFVLSSNVFIFCAQPDFPDILGEFSSLLRFVY